MKSLENIEDKAEVLKRLEKLPANAQRQWGKMTVNQMFCHLSDSFEAVMGKKEFIPADNIFTRTIVKWVALQLPVAWPKGIKTRPELDQLQGGTKPKEFERDKQRLRELAEVFSTSSDFANWQHPIFGKMAYSDWQRWGYLHIDHHLRQFGG